MLPPTFAPAPTCAEYLFWNRLPIPAAVTLPFTSALPEFTAANPDTARLPSTMQALSSIEPFWMMRLPSMRESRWQVFAPLLFLITKSAVRPLTSEVTITSLIVMSEVAP